MKKDNIHYFLGVNSPYGFTGFFDQLNNADSGIFCHILKGGPGTGKSTFMKNTAEEMLKRNFRVDFIHCSSDPDSLDGIFIRDKSVTLADGTAPHVIEPRYPGAVEEIINLGEAWNSGEIRKNKEMIVKTAKENSAAHERCIRFLKGAEMMNEDSRRIQNSFTDTEKLYAYADRLSRRLIKRKKSGERGREQKLFLSAVTPKGVVFFGDTVNALAENIIVIDDSIGAVSERLTERIREDALSCGYDVMSAYCPLNPKGAPEHIIIPECSLAFVRGHCVCQPEGSRIIHAKRFVNGDEMNKHKQRLTFNRKVRDDMILQAVSALRSAKAIHDKLEGYYIPNMDFRMLKGMQEELINKILSE